MADTHFKIVFEGQLQQGVELQTAKLNLAQLFKSEISAVEKLFSGKPISLKRGLTHTDAQAYLKALSDAGVQARIEADPAISLSLDDVEEPAAYQPPLATTASSPYAPPRAPVGAPVAEYAQLKVFTVQGRIGRVRYLAWTLALMLVALVVMGLCTAVMSLTLVGGGLLMAVAVVAFALVSVQIGAQRLHDVGWSAWLLLLNLVPFVGSVFPILMVVMPGNTGPNQYGPPAPPNSRGVKVMAWLWVLFIVLVIIAGVAGGLSALKEELDSTTTEYEKSLPYDDDEQEQPAKPAAASAGNFFKGEDNK